MGEPSELNSCLPTHVKRRTRDHAACRRLSWKKRYGDRCWDWSLRSRGSRTWSLSRRSRFIISWHVNHRRNLLVTWRLRLPCIAFRVTAFDGDRASNTNVYNTRADALESTKISTADRLPPKGPLLACPWIHGLLDLGTPHGHLRDAGRVCCARKLKLILYIQNTAKPTEREKVNTIFGKST